MILNIYKPKGWTSFDVVAKIRNLSKQKKVGHAGTLDPLAEGVLVILMGEDTKKQQFIMNSVKEYYFECTFGIYTESYDLEFLPKVSKSIEKATIELHINELLKKFIGAQDQTVPLYSAKKVHGKRLYDLARKQTFNTNDPLPVNKITIFGFSDISISEENTETTNGTCLLPVLKCKVKCSSGTYIRSLVRDIGLLLDTDAVMTKLIRTAVGDYTIDKSLKLEDLVF